LSGQALTYGESRRSNGDWYFVGRRPQQFGAMHRDLSRGFDSQADLVAMDFNQGDGDPTVDHDTLAEFSGKNEHQESSMTGSK
jgi:hypothetical protein